MLFRSNGVTEQGATIDPNIVDSGKWYHLVFTNDGLNLKLWLNGKLVGALLLASTTWTGGGNPFGVGLVSTQSNENVRWAGSITDIAVYQFVLSQEAIWAH